MTVSVGRLAMMQPYLFPYLGYLALVEATDVFVVMDHVQYLRRGWMHRNRFAEGDDWRWAGLRVVKAPRETPITDVRLRDDSFAELMAVTERYRGVASHAEDAVDLVNACAAAATSSFTDTVVSSLVLTCEMLGLALDGPPTRTSTLELERAPGTGAEGWALALCGRLGATTYVNAPGGRDLYPREPFADAGLGLAFIEPSLPPYDRGGAPWIAGLSVVDAIAHAGPAATAAMVRAAALDVVVRPR